ncbi:MAG: IS5 family transposase [Nitrosopumilus sp.]
MTPYKINNDQNRFFEQRLSEMLNPKQELYQLAQLINWELFEKEFGKLYALGKGQPPKPIRLIIGLMILQQIFEIADEEMEVVWVQNPYFQFFCGFDYFQWKFPIDPSSLSRWRNRLGVEGAELILQETIRIAKETETVKKTSLKTVIVDTTVMPKNIAYPLDIKLYAKGCEKIVKLAKALNIQLRQTYLHVIKKSLRNNSRYAHCRKIKLAKKEERKVKTYLGRLNRDIRRKINKIGYKENEEFFLDIDRLLEQKKEDKNKLYSLHEPQVECIAKGKAHQKYEFGCKVSIVATHKEGLVLSSRALIGNPYDGHTLEGSLGHAENITKSKIDQAYVDKGYRGHKIKDKQVLISGQRNLSQWFRKKLNRRQAIEACISNMKRYGRLARNFLKGQKGDQINALFCGNGHNLRMILRKIRVFFIQILSSMFKRPYFVVIEVS